MRTISMIHLLHWILPCLREEQVSSSGSSSKHKSPPQASSGKEKDEHKTLKIRSYTLLQSRKLCGQLITNRKGKSSFQIEFQKRRASQPMIWKYLGTKNCR
ncbi:unnamed protein product [Cuscuta epithymum]|uniref:Secreted protein n=1 Tax=Cuscuta epithymum TaxID=186058 RepID=A0AAV0DSH2_9ASTE|nr:unnamed protein product [Cuscuta epithymum]